MQVFLLIYETCIEDRDVVRVYIDPVIAQEQCEEMNKIYRENNPAPRISDVYYVQRDPIEVVE